MSDYIHTTEYAGYMDGYKRGYASVTVPLRRLTDAQYLTDARRRARRMYGDVDAAGRFMSDWRRGFENGKIAARIEKETEQ